ncbi:ArsR/SmtB family transcription factor [Microbacterium sp. NPDC058389]|uniref:ArsR/SmtB family transcription factor n=1 Tax=Microbacterium sp. NPDC058389 TaxID=3346475 RepID=UPI00365AB4FF
MLAALADPIRRSIVAQLLESGDAQPCGAFELPIAKATTTYHFRVLREAGLIRQHYEGTTIQNQLRREDLTEAFPGLLDAVFARQA